MRVALLLACLSLLAAPARADAPPTPSDRATATHSFADVAQWSKVFDDPKRDAWQKPRELVAALALPPGATVADLGAGTGYFSLPIATRVPNGRVYAVDIQQEMLDIVANRAASAGLANVTPVLATETDPRLPAGTVDLVLMVDAYHEFSHPLEVMTGVVRALKPGGRVVLIEYRAEDPAVPILALHKMSEAQAKKEMQAVGLECEKTLALLPQQHFMVFAKP